MGKQRSNEQSKSIISAVAMPLSDIFMAATAADKNDARSRSRSPCAASSSQLETPVCFKWKERFLAALGFDGSKLSKPLSKPLAPRLNSFGPPCANGWNLYILDN